ncbi:Putative coenzyme F420-dependent oxidoreductase [bacterium HR29]|jgi:F420-dependent oxidoreductase-like protein|nr:Putative coenzyme F420-dependent oxidoreductase [bacterium HR29]
MRVAIGIGTWNGDWEREAAYLREAERLGVTSAWSSEAWGFDAFTPLAYLAARTERLLLGTGIAQVGTRTPGVLAMTALTLASLTKGRFLLGLGVSGPQVIEGLHGVPFERTLTRLRETAAILRMAMRGERLLFEGECYRLPLPGGEGKALRLAAPPRPVPIYFATLGPRALEATGELADGWIASAFLASRGHVFVEAIRRGAERAGRTLEGFDIQAGGVVAFSDDVERLAAARKPGFAFEIGAMGSPRRNFYKDAYVRQGWGELAERVQELWLAGRRDEAAAIIPDEFVLDANLLGTEAMVRERVRAYRRAGVTTLRVEPAGETLDERLETLARFVQLVGEADTEEPPRA